MPPVLTEAARQPKKRSRIAETKSTVHDSSWALRTLEKHILMDGFKVVIDLDKSRGSYLYDAATGRRLIDFYGFFGSLTIGFNHPYFDEPAVKENLLCAAKFKIANSDVYSGDYAEFVDTLSRVAGFPPLDRYLFIEGGALAIENTLKAAMDWKVRKNMVAGRGERGTEILHFRRAFHGRSGYTMSLTNTDPRKTDLFAKFNDERGIDIAAIIIEPIQGEGGDNHFRGEWLRKLREICDENNILLIFDEVQTGLCTTGRTWCCQHFDVQPDLLAFGKKVQVCGVMAGPRLDEVKDNAFRLPSRLNSTWGGNFTDMVRSTHYLRVIEKENLVGNAGKVGAYFLEQLLDWQRECEIVSAVRGRGLFIAFDLPDAETRDDVWRKLFDSGVLVLKSGERSIRFRPALDVKKEVVDEAMEILRKQCKRR